MQIYEYKCVFLHFDKKPTVVTYATNATNDMNVTSDTNVSNDSYDSKQNPLPMTEIKIVNRGHQPLPAYATAQSAGMDLRANLDAPVVLRPLQRAMIKTGLHIALPEGYEAQVRPRSGLAFKHGVTVINSPGTIDADYRGEIGVLLVNLGSEDFVVNDGERIAQMVVARHEKVEFTLVETLDETERGEGGFGHTGKK